MELRNRAEKSEHGAVIFGCRLSAAELDPRRDRWIEMTAGPIDENVALPERPRKPRDKVYAITNSCGEKFEIARGVHAFRDGFDGIVMSGREGLAEPDPRIFELFPTRFGRAEDVLFIDDCERDVVAARGVGTPALPFVGGLDVEAEPRARGRLAETAASPNPPSPARAPTPSPLRKLR